MDGLEAIEMKLSGVTNENNTFRVDSEFFKKQYLKEDIERKRYSNIVLGDIAYITDGQHGYHEVDENSNISHLTAKNAKNWFADNIGADKLAKWVDDNNKRSSLIVNDIILSTRGSVGYCAIVKENVLPANIDQDVARIALKNNSIVRPEFLVTYLNSKFGQDWINRNASGMVQQGIPLAKVREMPIPVVARNIQAKVIELLNKSFSLMIEYKKYYQFAESDLLAELGIKCWNVSHGSMSMKSFSKSFGLTGRIDAEYYHPKYDEIEKIIKGYKYGYSYIKDAFNQNKDEFDKTLIGYNYIEIGDINIADSMAGYNYIATGDLPSNAKIKINEGDLLYSKVRPYRGAVSIVNFHKDDLIASGAFTVLREKGTLVNKETLMVLLKTNLYKEFIMKYNVGSSYPTVKDDDVLNLIIPKIPPNVQDVIKYRILDMYTLKNNSTKLLELATKGIEKAIEEGEEAAMNWINKRVDELGIKL